ncbi:unnamed protein product [Caenorhabditis angaria]|uniref:Uncharacterized protein n=1 Tax=Caenorhabditis angaria TaxID=860376 RepID=A0A9P1N1Z0_9PELO|nr:unnamed protein product [Caenorhabditis angaria]
MNNFTVNQSIVPEQAGTPNTAKDLPESVEDVTTSPENCLTEMLKKFDKLMNAQPEFADELRRNAPKITHEQIIDDLRGLFGQETAELIRNQNANFHASSFGNSEHPNTSARAVDFDDNVSDSNIGQEDVVVAPEFENIEELRAPENANATNMSESGSTAEESVETSTKSNSNILNGNIGQEEDFENDVVASLKGIIEQVLEMAAKSTKSLNQEIVNESPTTTETPVDRPSTYEPTLSSALAFLARLEKLLPCSQPQGANAQMQQPNRQADPERVSAPESGNVEDMQMPEISGLPETGSTAQESRIETSSNSPSENQKQVMPGNVVIRSPGNGKAVQESRIETSSNCPPDNQHVMQPGNVVIRSPGNGKAVQESRIETSSNCPPDNQHVMQPGNVVIRSPAAAQHSQQAVRQSKFRRHVSRLLNPAPRYETASESSEDDDFERRAENPRSSQPTQQPAPEHHTANSSPLRRKPSTPTFSSNNSTPKSSSSSQHSTPPGTPPPSYEIPRTSNPAISVNSINNGLHSLKISPNLFADGVRFIIDGNEIRAIGTLKHNLLEVVGDETVEILTRNVGVVQMENLIRKRLEREFEASLVDYKGTKIPKIAYEKLIALDALNAFRDDDDDDQFAQPNRMQRKRKAAPPSNDVAVNPKRRKVMRKPARARAPTRLAIVAPPKPIAPTGPPPKSARLAARQLAAAATPPASPSNQSHHSSKRRSDSSSNQSPTKKAKTGPELKTIDEAQVELLQIEMALQTRSFGFHGLDLLTEHRRMMRAVVSYNNAPTPDKLAKILSKTRSLSDEVERLAQ